MAESPGYAKSLAISEGGDLDAKVRRVTDGKVFHIGLSWLRTANKSDSFYTALNDYSVWQFNY